MYVSGIQCISGWWAHGTHYYIVYPEYASLLYYTVTQTYFYTILIRILILEC